MSQLLAPRNEKWCYNEMCLLKKKQDSAYVFLIFYQWTWLRLSTTTVIFYAAVNFYFKTGININTAGCFFNCEKLSSLLQSSTALYFLANVCLFMKIYYNCGSTHITLIFIASRLEKLSVSKHTSLQSCEILAQQLQFVCWAQVVIRSQSLNRR